jgi:hypothetical protein
MPPYSSRRGKGSSFAQVNSSGSSGVHLRTLGRRRQNNDGHRLPHYATNEYISNAQLGAQRERENAERRSLLQGGFICLFIRTMS